MNHSRQPVLPVAIRSAQRTWTIIMKTTFVFRCADRAMVLHPGLRLTWTHSPVYRPLPHASQPCVGHCSGCAVAARLACCRIVGAGARAGAVASEASQVTCRIVPRCGVECFNGRHGSCALDPAEPRLGCCRRRLFGRTADGRSVSSSRWAYAVEVDFGLQRCESRLVRKIGLPAIGSQRRLRQHRRPLLWPGRPSCETARTA